MTYNPYQDRSLNFRSIYSNKHIKTNLLPARKAQLEAVNTIYRALEGSLSPAIYLVSMPVGGGKSTLIMNALRVYKDVGFQPDGGVIVALHTLEGVEKFATECGLGSQDYAVFTRDEKLNGFGRGAVGINEAPVLFTTQQMVLARMEREGSFAGVTDLHYRGRPRRGKIWDESLEPARGIVLALDTLQSLPAKLRRQEPSFIAALDQLLDAVRDAEQRSALVISPAFKSLGAAVIAKFEAHKLSKTEQEAVRGLVALAGRTVGVEQGMQRQLALIGVGYVLPADFMPVIVFDASIPLRDTYRLFEQHQGNVVRLPAVEHCYRDTTVHLCKIGMGTDRLADPAHRALVLSAAADLINADPDEDWLVIHHMAKEDRYDIETELKGLLNDRRQARFIHWGDHYGSNDYRDIRKVIVIGTWRKPDWVYAAMFMASSGLGYDAVTTEARQRLRLGEHSHDLMQGVGRSNIRNVDDEGIAGKADVYLFASPEKGLEKRIQGVFPGSKVVAWQPVYREASGHLAAVITYLSSNLIDVLTKEHVRKAVGISTSQGLRNVTKDKRFERFLERAGIEMERYKFIRRLV